MRKPIKVQMLMFFLTLLLSSCATYRPHASNACATKLDADQSDFTVLKEKPNWMVYGDPKESYKHILMEIWERKTIIHRNFPFQFANRNLFSNPLVISIGKFQRSISTPAPGLGSKSNLPTQVQNSLIYWGGEGSLVNCSTREIFHVSKKATVAADIRVTTIGNAENNKIEILGSGKGLQFDLSIFNKASYSEIYNKSLNKSFVYESIVNSRYISKEIRRWMSGGPKPGRNSKNSYRGVTEGTIWALSTIHPNHKKLEAMWDQFKALGAEKYSRIITNQWSGLTSQVFNARCLVTISDLKNDQGGMTFVVVGGKILVQDKWHPINLNTMTTEIDGEEYKARNGGVVKLNNRLFQINNFIFAPL